MPRTTELFPERGIREGAASIVHESRLGFLFRLLYCVNVSWLPQVVRGVFAY